jgi:D-alanyl-D-alanine carboxypeptidase/D-alanyl-D-alanine-endopeptidase (penicillin-binding protein 4)
MTRRLAAPLAALAMLLPGVAAPAASGAGLPATQRVLAREMAASGPATGAYVVDLATGAELFAANADVPRMPASVNKLYTTATALRRFGADRRLTTDVLVAAPPDDFGVITGDLYLHGGGDPVFATRDARSLAEALAADGVTEVTGRVIGDESAWDGLRGGPASSYRTSMWVGPLSALSLDRGMVRRRFQTDPPRSAATTFSSELENAGILVGAKPRAGVTPPGAVPLASWPSPTIAQLVAATNTESDNFLAESLLKATGAAFGLAGSTAAGATVVRATVEGLGGAHPSILDGSGLSRRDRTTPRDVVRLIAAMDGTDIAAPFEASLPVAGRTGTLKKRMRRTTALDRCHAKTGTLSDVSALAGYCDTLGGHRVAFAFLMNRVSTFWARVHQDRMTVALSRYG